MNKIYTLVLSVIAFGMGMTSCLNDSMIEDQKYGLIDLDVNKIIELPAGGTHTVDITSLDEGKKDFMRELRLAADQPAKEDIVVSLEVVSDRATIIKEIRELLSDRYPEDGENAVSDEEILTFAATGITVPATVTIPKGARSVNFPVNIDTHLLKPTPQFILVRIKSVDKPGYIVSGNFGQLLLNLKLRHQYEGRYVLTGTMEHLPSPGAYVHITTIFDPEPYTVQLQTFDGQSVIFYEEMGWSDYIYPIATATGGYSGWGSFAPIFKFDDQGNVIAVTNYYGQPAGNTRSALLDPSGVNKYDPATKSFQVSYWMVQPSVVSAPPHYRTHMVETYTFLEDL
ncbi:MAG: hypothetical protein LLF81_11275 [Porphyromonadaceae bacterium]|nr:hypothetical protein [Porphyromonadaceae bacterium]